MSDQRFPTAPTSSQLGEDSMNIAKLGLAEGISRFGNVLHPYGVSRDLEASVVTIGPAKSTRRFLVGHKPFLGLGRSSLRLGPADKTVVTASTGQGRQGAALVRRDYSAMVGLVGERPVTSLKQLGSSSNPTGIRSAFVRTDDSGTYALNVDPDRIHELPADAATGWKRLQQSFANYQHKTGLEHPGTGGA